MTFCAEFWNPKADENLTEESPKVEETKVPAKAEPIVAAKQEVLNKDGGTTAPPPPAIVEKREEAPPEVKQAPMPVKKPAMTAPKVGTSKSVESSDGRFYKGASNPGIIGETAMVTRKLHSFKSFQHNWYIEGGSIGRHIYAGMGQMSIPVLLHEQQIRELNTAYYQKREEMLRAVDNFLRSNTPQQLFQGNILPYLQMGSSAKALDGIAIPPAKAIKFSAGRRPETDEGEGMPYELSKLEPDLYGPFSTRAENRYDTHAVTMVSQQLYAPLPYHDLLMLIYKLAKSIGSMKSSTVDLLDLYAAEYMIRLDQELKDVFAAEVNNNKNVHEALEFLEMYHLLDGIDWIITAMANTPYVLFILQKEAGFWEEDRKEFFNWLPKDGIKTWPSWTDQCKLRYEPEYGLVVDKFQRPSLDSETNEIVADDTYLYPSAVMMMKLLRDRLSTVTPRLLSIPINLETESTVETIDSAMTDGMLNKFNMLLELIQMLPDMAQIQPSFIDESFTLTTRGDFSGFTFYPKWRRVHYFMAAITSKVRNVLSTKGIQSWSQNLSSSQAGSSMQYRLAASLRTSPFFKKWRPYWLMPNAITHSDPPGTSIGIGTNALKPVDSELPFSTVVHPSQLGWIIYMPVVCTLGTYTLLKEMLMGVQHRGNALFLAGYEKEPAKEKGKPATYTKKKPLHFWSLNNKKLTHVSSATLKDQKPDEVVSLHEWNPAVLILGPRLYMTDPQLLSYITMPSVVLRETAGPTLFVTGPLMVPKAEEFRKCGVPIMWVLQKEGEYEGFAAPDGSRILRNVDWLKPNILM